jgi:hypothetical protein
MAITEEELQAEHERRLTRLRAVAIDAELRRGTLPKHVFWGRCYRNTAFLRLKGLERGIAACLRYDEPVSALILARQFVETAAHYISTTLYVEKQLRKSPPDLERVSERIGSALFGTKLQGVEAFTAEQVMNCIDDCDAHIRKVLPEVAEHERRPVRSAYEVDSEFTHPNGFAFRYHMDVQGEDSATTVVLFGEHAHELAHTIGPRVRRALIIIDILLSREPEFASALAKGVGDV